MADTTVTPQSATGNQTPDVSAAAPAAVAPAATAPAATSAPAAPAPAQAQPQPQVAPATTPYNPAAASIAAAQQAAQQAQAAAAESTAPPPAGPHARLLSMVQGLAVGLGSFGKAIATHGKEGGVEDVLAYQNQQKQQDIQAQQARDAAKNQKIQQAVAAVNTNLAMANGYNLMARLPGEMTKDSLSNTQTALQNVETSWTEALQTGNFSNWKAAKRQLDVTQGGNPAQMAAPAAPAAAPGTVLAQEEVPRQAVTQWQGGVGVAASTFPTDPVIMQAQKTVNDPKSSPEEMARAYAQANNRMQQLGAGQKMQEAQADLQKKINDNDILYKYKNDPKQLTDPGA